ncbi:MAG: hypothetical protein ACYDH3_10485 [Candidatus Aminicenantales bacterium]
MSSAYRNKLILAAALTAGIFIGLARSAAPADHPDFSGRWILDLSRSELQPGPSKNLTAGIFKIDHKDPVFSAHREFTRAGKINTLDFTLSTDGREVEENEDGMPTSSSLRWDGDSLVFLTIYQTPRGEARNTVIYRLLDDGKTLRAEESFRGPRIKYDNIWIFAKGD